VVLSVATIAANNGMPFALELASQVVQLLKYSLTKRCGVSPHAAITLNAENSGNFFRIPASNPQLNKWFPVFHDPPVSNGLARE
jgi:hypothetical protein